MTDAGHDDFDNPWKAILEHAFPELLAFYFPAAHAQIDWTHAPEFLNTELRQVVRDAELGRRGADALVRVCARDGSEHWIYLHIEIQSQSDSGFAQRMFTYNYRLYDRYARPIASLAVLADAAPDWRPSAFELEQLGCTHRFCFPVVKLLDFDDRLGELETDPNPLALVTAAHLYTVRTRHDPAARFQFKRRLVGLLYGQGWDRQRILDLFAILDWMMRLPDALERRLWQEIRAIEEAGEMPYVTSIERLAIERGRQEGQREGEVHGRATLLAIQLVKRFGPLPEAIQTRLAQATNEQLERWGERLLEAATLDAVFEDH